MVERHVLGTIGLTKAERHVSGMIGLTMAKRHVSGTTRLMMAEKHVSGTIGLTTAERHEITREHVTHGQQTCVSPTTSVRAHGSAPWPIACHARGFGGGIPSPKDARSRRDFEAMKSCHDITSAISEEALESIRECYSIPEGYVLRAPSPEQRPYQPQPSEISIPVGVLEAGLRFPLHSTIVKCLRWWRISPSQMAPNSWRYLIAFLGECQGAGLVPSRTLFFACFRLCKSRGDYYLTARAGFKVSGASTNNKGWKAWYFFVTEGGSHTCGGFGEAIRRGSTPDPTTTGRPEKQDKITVRRHKAHRDEGSSRRADREREPEVSVGDASPTYHRQVDEGLVRHADSGGR
ncbi:hypothetical protein BHM03_00057134 [Ensete ventricosum]|nr:hypothetical protein BHM03_00057134 [Ensete ventricosum]